MSDSGSKFFLLTLWYRPVYSMSCLLSAGKGHFMALMVAAFFGVVQSSRLVFLQTEPIFLYLLAGGLAGIMCLYLFGWLVRNFGRWFGADATQRDVRVALGLGMLPWMLAFAIIAILLYIGVSDVMIAEYASVISVIFVYSCIILVLSLSVALQISVIKTFICLVVTVLFSVFPLTLLAQVLTGLIR